MIQRIISLEVISDKNIEGLAYPQVIWNEYRSVVEEIQQYPNQNCLLFFLHEHIILGIIFVIDCVHTSKCLFRVPLLVDLEEFFPFIKLIYVFLP